MNKCYSAQEYASLSNYVFDDEMDDWFERNVGDREDWQKDLDLVQRYQDLANSKKDEWEALRKFWLTPEEEDFMYENYPRCCHDKPCDDYWIDHQITKHRLNEEAGEILKRAVKKKLAAKKAENGKD